ncbi:MAG: hypothetical protein KAI24_24450, partial [Planctomycetes bacterium]|nr:hypothetical protein [Planctomycetota bacterium]
MTDHDSNAVAAVDTEVEATLLVEDLVAALVNSRIYAVDHPRVRSSIEQVHTRVATLCEADDSESVRIGIYDGLLIYRHKPLLGASIGVRRWSEKLAEYGSGGVEFDAGVSTTDLSLFFATVLERQEERINWSQCNDLIALRQCVGVRLLPPYTDGVEESIGDPVKLGLDFPR